MRIVVLGGGVCGLAASMMLTRDGHEVTVLERDEQPAPQAPAEAWDAWDRAGVAQFRQPHFLAPGGRFVLEETLPDVVAALAAAGAAHFDVLRFMPPSITDRTPRPGDERLATITARRPTLETVLARAAQDEPGLAIRRGTTVAELTLCELDGTPHATGVRTTSGEQVRAELVVDATGRGSQMPSWLRAAGVAPMHEESEPSGFIYYTQYFRAPAGGSVPQPRSALLTATAGSPSTGARSSRASRSWATPGRAPTPRWASGSRWGYATSGACARSSVRTGNGQGSSPTPGTR